MLSKSENDVMGAVYCLCDGTESCLVSVADILSILPAKKKFTCERVENILKNLQGDGYFDLIVSERKGEKMYVISLKANGLNFKRIAKQRQRDILYKILLAFVGAAATFIFGLILKGLFG